MCTYDVVHLRACVIVYPTVEDVPEDFFNVTESDMRVLFNDLQKKTYDLAFYLIPLLRNLYVTENSEQYLKLMYCLFLATFPRWLKRYFFL